jgi:hypothetical protein
MAQPDRETSSRRKKVRWKIVLGVLVGALLVSGLLVGVSYGDDQVRVASTSDPTVLELWWNTLGARSEVRYFLIAEDGGRCGDDDPVCLQITEKDMPLFDVDGNEVGRQLISCSVTDVTGWNCTYITKIKDGPNTDTGQVVAIGTKRPSDVHTIVVTGGSGAYENAGGHARQVGQEGKVTYTLYLTPAA